MQLRENDFRPRLPPSRPVDIIESEVEWLATSGGGNFTSCQLAWSCYDFRSRIKLDRADLERTQFSRDLEWRERSKYYTTYKHHCRLWLIFDCIHYLFVYLQNKGQDARVGAFTTPTGKRYVHGDCRGTTDTREHEGLGQGLRATCSNPLSETERRNYGRRGGGTM